jgi:threonine dehydratase
MAIRTPLIPSVALSNLTGGAVKLKLENMQPTGSFKIRGAANKSLSLSPEELSKGLVTASTGNHGRAVSYAGKLLEAKTVVCVSVGVAEEKLAAIQDLGAEIVTAGATFEEALAAAIRMGEEKGMTFVHPYDDLAIIAGQGTIGLELIEDWTELDTAIIPLSGGGLFAGIATALKGMKPDVRCIGVSMEIGAAMAESLKAGKVVDVVEKGTLADALAGGLGKNLYTLPLVQGLIDEVVLVSEKEIAAAMLFCFNEQKQVVEGGGAVGVAALMSGKVSDLGEKVAVVLSGGNVGPGKLAGIAGE